MESPFDTLGIQPGADEAEIKRAYKRRVKEAHPDHGGSVEEFQAVRAAYERLTSDGSVARFDAGEDAEESRRPETAEVEYLDYAVLDDYGWGLDDPDLFEKASKAGLDPADYGRFTAETDELLLESAEDRGFTWPYSCRGGACANCAVAVREGELSMPSSHILPSEMLDRGFRLSCVGTPATSELQVVYNVKHVPDLDELRLPPGPFEHAQD